MAPRSQLKALRKSQNQSQKSMAEHLGITASYYGMIELGVRQPSLDIARRIAALVGSTVEELFGEDHSESVAA